MKRRRCLASVAALLLLLALMVGLSHAQGPGPQETTKAQTALGGGFTYQGRLTDSDGNPVSDICSLDFTLWDAESGGSPVGHQIVTGVEVDDGYLTVLLNSGGEFGAHAFEGEVRWLKIAVKCSGDTNWNILPERQLLSAAPYALSLRPGAVISGTVDGKSALTVVNGGDGPGGSFTSEAGDGIYVEYAGGDGVSVYKPGRYGVYVEEPGQRGVRVDSAGTDGVYVYEPGQDGVYVDSPVRNGLKVLSPGQEGIHVDSPGRYGLLVSSPSDRGVRVDLAGTDGVYVYEPGQDGVYVDSPVRNGLKVLSPGQHGVCVDSAGDDGVHVESANGAGFEVVSAGGRGIRVGSTTLAGVLVESAGTDGVSVLSATGYGVYANTTDAAHEWGFYTDDKIYGGTTLVSGGALMLLAQNGDTRDLETGDVVALSAMGPAFGESDAPAPLVRRVAAANSTAAMGVVYQRFVTEEEVEEIERDGTLERHTTTRAHSADGPVGLGDYMLIVVLGPAQVKADALSTAIRSGDELTTSGEAGYAMKAQPLMLNGVAFYAPGTTIGKAMEPLDAADESGLIWAWVTLQ